METASVQIETSNQFPSSSFLGYFWWKNSFLDSSSNMYVEIETVVYATQILRSQDIVVLFEKDWKRESESEGII
jgi:hypothetical protein